MKILMTGASGLLGRHANDVLGAKGHDITTVSRSRKLTHETILADLGDPAEIEKLPREFDCVVHLAALLPAPARQVENEAWFRNNAQSTLNLLEFCARNGIPKFVYGSTWSVYGSTPADGPVTEKVEPQPADAYSLSKLSGEILTYPYGFTYGLEVKILRFSYIYGLGMREDTVVEKFIDLAAHSEDIALIGQGQDCTDLVYVKDAAEAVEAALSHGEGIYNIGSGERVTIRQLAEAIIHLTGSASRLRFKEGGYAIKKHFLSIEKASKELGWQPKHTLMSGLRGLIDGHQRGNPGKT